MTKKNLKFLLSSRRYQLGHLSLLDVLFLILFWKHLSPTALCSFCFFPLFFCFFVFISFHSLLYFWNRGLYSSLDWPGIQCVPQAGLDLRPSFLVSGILVWERARQTLNSWLLFGKKYNHFHYKNSHKYKYSSLFKEYSQNQYMCSISYNGHFTYANEMIDPQSMFCLFANGKSWNGIVWINSCPSISLISHFRNVCIYFNVNASDYQAGPKSRQIPLLHMYSSGLTWQ